VTEHDGAPLLDPPVARRRDARWMQDTASHVGVALAPFAREWPGEMSGPVTRQFTDVPQSYGWCMRLTRASRSSFYYSFFALPRALFRDMCVLYAFMRVSDDLGDDESVPVERRGALLAQWRAAAQRALSGDACEHPLLPALAHIVARHAIPSEHILAVIDGVRMDLSPQGFETFDDLAGYCYHVAGAVGLCCLRIWGSAGAEAIPLAIDCGLAFQLTNILRDVAEDARLGRCYLPREDLRRFGLTPADLRQGTPPPRLRELMQYEAARARAYFAASAPLVALCDPAGRPILDAMTKTYSTLLRAIELADYDVYRLRIHVGRLRRLRIVIGSMIKHRWARFVGRK
jgi:15-cis-phytoene synthase